MFDKLNQLKDLKNLRDKMKEERVIVERDGVKVVVNGAMEVEEISFDGEVDPELLRNCVNEAVKGVQKKMAGLLG